MGYFSASSETATPDFVPLFRSKTQATSQSSMKPSIMKSNIETMILKQILEQILDWNPTKHDRHFVKHVTNMHSTSHNNISEHRGLILI